MTNLDYDLDALTYALTLMEEALYALQALENKTANDCHLIHDMTAKRDDLRWMVLEAKADNGDKRALAELNRASERRPRD